MNQAQAYIASVAAAKLVGADNGTAALAGVGGLIANQILTSNKLREEARQAEMVRELVRQTEQDQRLANKTLDELAFTEEDLLKYAEADKSFKIREEARLLEEREEAEALKAQQPQSSTAFKVIVTVLVSLLPLTMALGMLTN